MLAPGDPVRQMIAGNEDIVVSQIEIDALRLINEEIDSIISDLAIETNLKEKIAEILFGELTIRKKRIEIRKLKNKGLEKNFVKMFIRLLEYIAQI